MNKETKNTELSNYKALHVADVRCSILRELNREKKKHLMRKNTPYIESRQYAIAHGELTAILNTMRIVKQYCV